MFFFTNDRLMYILKYLFPFSILFFIFFKGNISQKFKFNITRVFDNYQINPRLNESTGLKFEIANRTGYNSM